MKENKGVKILILSLAFSGILSTSSGIVLNNMTVKPTSKTIDVKVVEKKVARIKSNVPVLKDITVEINEPISVDVKQYIANIDDISSSVLKEFKLDTSLVNVTQAGKYVYVIEYKNKKYTGNVIVKDKELPSVNLQIKNLSFKLNGVLPTDVKSYLENSSLLTEEAIKTIILDVSKVDTKIPGEYQYTLTYNKQLYTGIITIYEEKPDQTINKISYTVRYVCGAKHIDDIKEVSSPTKTLVLNSSDITSLISNKIRDKELSQCNKGVLENISLIRGNVVENKDITRIEVQNEDIIKIDYKSNTIEEVQ